MGVLCDSRQRRERTLQEQQPQKLSVHHKPQSSSHKSSHGLSASILEPSTQRCGPQLSFLREDHKSALSKGLSTSSHQPRACTAGPASYGPAWSVRCRAGVTVPKGRITKVASLRQERKIQKRLDAPC